MPATATLSLAAIETDDPAPTGVVVAIETGAVRSAKSKRLPRHVRELPLPRARRMEVVALRDVLDAEREVENGVAVEGQWM